MEEVLEFYSLLAENNYKAWFDENRAWYEEIKKKTRAFAMDFMHRVEAFDPRVRDLQVNDITYRINRDIRFSPDKRPYKDWFGVYVCPKGKKSGMAGYYIHMEPATNTYFICAGLYNPTKEVLQSVREEIMLEPENFHQQIVNCGSGWELNWEQALKKMPRGYQETDQHSEYYRLKSFEVYKKMKREDMLRPDFLDRAIKEFKKCYAFNELLNKCAEY